MTKMSVKEAAFLSRIRWWGNMFGQGVGGDSYLKLLSWHHFEDGQLLYEDDFNASSNFAFASMFKYYHFVFDTTSWSSLIFIYTLLCVDCWSSPGRVILIDWSLHGRVISHLNVSSVHSSDGGLYRCQAQNSVSFYDIKDIVVHNVYSYLRWGWSLTPQGWMCMVRHHRVVCRMSPLSRGFRIFYQHPRDTLLEAPNISDDKKERKGTLFKPNIPPES